MVRAGKMLRLLSTSTRAKSRAVDVLVVGAGHNGLVASTLLARQGLNVDVQSLTLTPPPSPTRMQARTHTPTHTLNTAAGMQVHVLEAKNAVGGACKTEYPFAAAPGLGTSTGAYLLGVMPPELIKLLGLRLPLLRRDPHYFLPTTDDRYLLFGSDQGAMKRHFLEYFSEQDWRANEKLQVHVLSKSIFKKSYFEWCVDHLLRTLPPLHHQLRMVPQDQFSSDNNKHIKHAHARQRLGSCALI